MNKEKWSILTSEFVIFFHNFAFPKENEKASFVSNFSEEFDGQQSILPIPPDAPKEFPRIILESEDKKKKIQFFLDKVSIVFDSKIKIENKEEFLFSNDNKNEIKDIILRTLDIFDKSKVYFEIGHVGFVINSINPVENSNNEAEKLLNDKKIFDLSDDQNDLAIIYVNRNYKMVINEAEIDCNNMMSIGSNIRNINTKKQVGIRVIFDVNNRRANEGSVASKKDFEGFVDNVFSKNEEFFNKL